MEKTAVELKNVSKKLGKETVLKPMDVSFQDGRIYGLCGRNGSGKTVLLKLICGLYQTDTGSVTVYGKELGKDCDFPDQIGVMLETPGFLKGKTGFENLKYLAKIKGKISEDMIRQQMERMGLEWNSKKKVGTYSLGMRQRLGITQAMMEDPQLLILDEPMNGLDREGAALVRGLLREWKEKGKLIILASHLRADLEEVCDEVYEIADGEIRRLLME